MVTAAEIGWGKYRQYEGPFYKGKFGFKLPSEPTENDRILAVITATEGGHYDAWNGYDVCGWTSGLIQWCERGQYSVSDMLGAVSVFDDELISGVDTYARSFGLSFQRNVKGRFRFFFNDSRGEVDSAEEQRQLFYLRGDGTQGSWSDEMRLYAKGWGAVISTVWESVQAQSIQKQYTVARLGGFMTSYAKTVFATAVDTPTARAARAAYLSFAANNPTWASNSLKRAVDTTTAPQWTQEWFVAVLKELTFGPKVAIYPHRYDAIRPVLERLYGIELPDFSSELQAWSEASGIPPGLTTVRLQRALLALGYDLGPKRDDGVYGKKTREALLTLEQLSGMVPSERQDGMLDEFTWPALQSALSAKGLEMPA